ncbi:conserved hypothetical protein [Mycolicibacter sinensis]|uniref:Methyltransferase domain-containing protein n=1 Tax=Mycolicibacter sinensis (strain JDM601) TaxID=875328 RepID=F5YVK0_MYCSD|nr:conserved hypothetical protein [Mycolicibacter sinensis]
MTGASGPSAGDAERFEEIYRAAAGLPAATPWDIGGAQPVVRRLVALGAIKGAVLDPGTGPGHHAVHFAEHGFAATGVDVSETAIEGARANARLRRPGSGRSHSGWRSSNRCWTASWRTPRSGKSTPPGWISFSTRRACR